MTDNIPVLETRGITKVFPGVIANEDVNLTLNKSEVLALLGENGAGKSTLMNIIYGLYQPTEGEILVNGEVVKMSTPNDAIEMGIGMVHQHFQLVPVMTVAENIMLGSETIKRGLLDTKTVADRIIELSHRYDLDVDPYAMVEDLPVGMRQRVEIVKTLYRNADILILDEPTAVLTPQEIEGLFEVMELLKEQGKSIIFISHKLKEVLRVADRIGVLRNGRVVGEADPKTATQASLAAMMVGREVILTVEKGEAHPTDEVLEVQGLRAKNDLGESALNGVGLTVRAGEVVGIAGVQGNGQTELVEVITGLRKCDDGKVVLNGVDITNETPRKITQEGHSSHVPEDRHAYGMVDTYSVAENLVLNTYNLFPFVKRLTINQPAIQEHAEALVEQFDVRTPSVGTAGGSLSGGNQQKMVVAREFSRPTNLLIAAQPTRGIDVGSIEFIHNQIIAKRDESVAVLVVSSELDEIMALSDRIAVMYKGEIIGIVPREEATREGLGLLMAGVRGDEAPVAWLMDPFDPILDRPHSVDYDSLHSETTFRLANHDIVFHADGQTDLRDLFWPWADAVYARHIKLRIRDMNDDDFMPMVTQFYPGYQETILGTEGMIVSKQLAVPFNASYDRAVIWLLQCQAEGDRLLRLDIDIDWGEPLVQRLVDGLLVAQRDPQSKRGLYAQRNAESTRVFGNPQARPQSSDLSDPQRAQLTYYVLVNGMIEVPLLLTVSDVGEQVAWNGFLALRDSELAFEQSVSEWTTKVKTGRLWTPDPRFNRAVQEGRLATLRWTQRLRTGLSVTDRDISRIGILIDSLDTVELVQSRNLLANLRRLAGKGEGAVPPMAPLRRKDPLVEPGDALPRLNAVYLRALQDLLWRRFDPELLSQHYSTVQACAERIVRERIKRFPGEPMAADVDWLYHAVDALTLATRLADLAGDDADLARWESEAAEYTRQANSLGATFPRDTTKFGWLAGDEDAIDSPWSSITLAGQAVWEGCGVRIEDNMAIVEPTFTEEWTWWALLDLPLDEEHSISLVWDGETLHSNTAVESRLPVRVHERIRILHTDEYDFDLQFELVDNVESGVGRRLFRPRFLTE